MNTDLEKDTDFHPDDLARSRVIESSIDRLSITDWTIEQLNASRANMTYNTVSYERKSIRTVNRNFLEQFNVEGGEGRGCMNII